MKNTRLVFYLLVVLFLSMGTKTSSIYAKGFILPTEKLEFKAPDYQKKVFKPEVILIPETAGWLVSLYAPYFDLLKKGDQAPNIISISMMRNEYQSELYRFTKQRVVESLVRDFLIEKTDFVSSDKFTYTQFKKYPSQSALSFLKRYTTSSPDIIVTTFKDIESFFQASMLATHFQIPLLPVDTALDRNTLAEAVKTFKVQRVFVVSNELPQVINSLPDDMIFQLKPDQVSQLYLDKIGRAQVQNVILTSIANRHTIDYTNADDATFFVPYISYLRKAPVFFSQAITGNANETSLGTFLDEYQLTPRNITILGDYSRIREINPHEELKKKVYDQEIALEPGTFYNSKFAVPYGSGRLPFNDLLQVSNYYARLTAHDQYYEQKARKFVMISNLIASEGAHLKFAEAVSKATVNELHNFGMKGKSFYARVPENKEIWEAALTSGLIIYEGHSNHFLAFDTEDVTSMVFSATDNFQKYPLLILQSCNSLDELDYLIKRGPVAIVGSSTRVHSASGSSFIKAYLDNTLYQPATLGEALRDAKNYFLSIVALKENRGHSEQAKANRVALSFRIWGDPEIKLFSQTLPAPKKQPLLAQVNSGNILEIKTPDKFHKSIKNEKYRLRSFPMAKQAGIVKRSKDSSETIRRIESFYFFKLPYQQLSQAGLEEFKEKSGLGDVRNVILEDRFKRWIYMLHYPKSEKKNTSLKIKLNNRSN